MRRRAFLGVVGTTSVTGCMGYTITREDYEQRLAAQNETIDELNEIIDDFEIQVADQSEQIDALEAEISTKESQLSSLENELSAAESDTDELESEISALEGELADAESDIDGLEAEIITLEEELSAVESERDTLESEVNELESEIDDLEETIKQLEPERDFSDGTIEQATNMALDLRGGVVYLQDHESSATGIHLGGGEYLTVAHAFTGFSFSWERSGKTIDGETFSWEKEEVESGNDLRLVSSDTSLSGSIDISDSAEPVPDEPVVIIGHPFNVGSGSPLLAGTMKQGTPTSSMPITSL